MKSNRKIRSHNPQHSPSTPTTLSQVVSIHSLGPLKLAFNVTTLSLLSLTTLFLTCPHCPSLHSTVSIHRWQPLTPVVSNNGPTNHWQDLTGQRSIHPRPLYLSNNCVSEQIWPYPLSSSPPCHGGKVGPQAYTLSHLSLFQFLKSLPASAALERQLF